MTDDIYLYIYELPLLWLSGRLVVTFTVSRIFNIKMQLKLIPCAVSPKERWQVTSINSALVRDELGRGRGHRKSGLWQLRPLCVVSRGRTRRELDFFTAYSLNQSRWRKWEKWTWDELKSWRVDDENENQWFYWLNQIPKQTVSSWTKVTEIWSGICCSS